MSQQTLDEANRALQQGRIDDAERLLRGAVQADPQSLTSHVALATVLASREQHAAAADTYANAMRIDRNAKGLALKYALSCFRAGRYDEAEKSARFAAQSDPSALAHDTLACALREQGKLPDALAASENALRLAPSNNAVQHTKGSILLAMGRSQEALTIFETLNSQGVVAPIITISRGAALEKLGRSQEAQRLYAEAAARWPDFAQIQRERAQRRH
ncbi:MAG: tetratricopeptide repeat protein [Proteobacteria bacterium]|nr:tetratricopeptide repeat protein [Pseudomonadota bacterium]